MSERTDRVAEYLFRTLFTVESYREYIAALSEFQEPKWIKCSDKPPADGQSVWFATKNYGVCAGKYQKNDQYSWHWGTCDNCNDSLAFNGATHWMPRQIPKPPVEEESQQVRDLLS